MTDSAMVIIAFQWVALLALAFVVIGLARQIGVLHNRLGPAGALMLSKSVKVGEASPEFHLKTIDNRDVKIGGAEPDGRSTLVMFVAPDCPVCERLIPTVKSIAKAEQAGTRVVFASEGDPVVHQMYRAKKGLEAYPYILAPELGMSYSIGKLPYAVLLDPQGVVASQGLVNSREHIESLFESHRMKVASIQDFLATHAHAHEGSDSAVRAVSK